MLRAQSSRLTAAAQVRLTLAVEPLGVKETILGPGMPNAARSVGWPVASIGWAKSNAYEEKAWLKPTDIRTYFPACVAVPSPTLPVYRATLGESPSTAPFGQPVTPAKPQLPFSTTMPSSGVPAFGGQDPPALSSPEARHRNSVGPLLIVELLKT